MRRVSSAPTLSEPAPCYIFPTQSKSLSNYSGGANKVPMMPAPLAKKDGMRARVKIGAVSMDMPIAGVETNAMHGQGPSPTEVVFAITKESFATAMECLPSLEMADAPPVEVAVCMATPVVPDEGGHGEEIRQRAASLGERVETELRLRYAEEVTLRAATRAGDLRRRKRSLNDADINENNNEVGEILPIRTNEEDDRFVDDKQLPKQKENNGKKGNVAPFKSSPGQSNVSPFRRVAKLSTKEQPQV